MLVGDQWAWRGGGTCRLGRLPVGLLFLMVWSRPASCSQSVVCHLLHPCLPIDQFPRQLGQEGTKPIESASFDVFQRRSRWDPGALPLGPGRGRPEGLLSVSG